MRSAKLHLGLSVVGTAVLLLAYGCADRSAFSTRELPQVENQGGAAGAAGASSQGGDSGVGGAGGEGGAPGKVCPLDASSPSAECAVYVQLDADGDGTKAHPLGSVNEAVALAIEEGRSHVFVCDGTYEETVAVGAGTVPLTIVGGLDCDTWKSDEGAETKIVPAVGTHALEIVSHEVTLRDLSIDVPDAVDPGASAIGAYVIDAHATFENVQITVGKGVAGAKGKLTPFKMGTAAQMVGKNSTSTSAGASTELICAAGDKSVGGAGGGKVGAASVVDGEDGLPINPNAPTKGSGGSGYTTPSCLTNSSGTAGSNGQDGASGEGATEVGSIANDRWSGANGTAGKPGQAGQGGGGGGGNAVGYSPGGGAGNCGGAGATGGQAGGSSIGIVAIRSEVVVQASIVQTSDAGAGGAGAGGQNAIRVGGAPGTPYTVGSTVYGCPAGAGGYGGDGGHGGGAAGGISVAVVSTSDSTVVLVETDTAQGAPGAKGEGPTDPLDGIPGVAQPTYTL